MNESQETALARLPHRRRDLVSGLTSGFWLERANEQAKGIGPS
jgi:hypothetical protein